jgi:hypothetical protein
MADSKQNGEFLGGGPKFNTVGKDNRPAAGFDEPIVPPNRTGYWVRVSGIVLIVVVLAGVLFYLNDSGLGKTVVTPGRGGQAVSPDAKNADIPSTLR